MSEFKKILVPLDFSSHSARALDVATELALRYDAELHLLHGLPSGMFSVTSFGPTYPSDLPPGYREDVRNRARARLTKLRDQATARGVEVSIHLSEYFPSEAILQHAQKIGADLIVMGTRGLTGLKHVMLGSIAERIVRMAECPVLTVKADEDPS